jgi:hypothetical protein
MVYNLSGRLHVRDVFMVIGTDSLAPDDGAEPSPSRFVDRKDHLISILQHM